MRIGEALALDRKPFEQGETEIEIIPKSKKQRTIFVSPPTLSGCGSNYHGRQTLTPLTSNPIRFFIFIFYRKGMMMEVP